MHLAIACRTCGACFDARTHAGLLQCDSCRSGTGLRLTAAEPAVIVLDTPGEAWA